MEISSFKFWNEAVSYYDKYGSSNALKNLFALGENAFTRKKLAEELKKIPSIVVPVPSPIRQGKPKIDRTNLPKNLQIEYDKLKSLIGEISYNNSQLSEDKSAEENLVLVNIISSKVKERRAIWQRLDNYVKTGIDLVPVVPEKLVDQVHDLKTLQLKNKLILLRSQRSKLKGKPEKVERFNKICAEIEDIKKQMGNG